jgi:hypothetical protein
MAKTHLMVRGGLKLSCNRSKGTLVEQNVAIRMSSEGARPNLAHILISTLDTFRIR